MFVANLFFGIDGSTPSIGIPPDGEEVIMEHSINVLPKWARKYIQDLLIEIDLLKGRSTSDIQQVYKKVSDEEPLFLTGIVSKSHPKENEWPCGISEIKEGSPLTIRVR